MIYPQNFEQKIGFDQIRQLLKEKCLSTLGEERVTDMAFSDRFSEVEEHLDQVFEFVRILREEDNFPAQYFFDVRPSLKRIRVEGMYLDEQELFDLRRSLETIRDIVRFLQKSEGEEEETASHYPCLKRLAGDSVSTTYRKNKRHSLSVWKNKRQRIRRAGAYPPRIGKHNGEHLSLTEQHFAQRTIGRNCRQGCCAHNARRTTGYSGSACPETENKRNCT